MVLWRRRSYAAVSVAHKVFAIAYYLLNMRATLRLGRPLYYQKGAGLAAHGRGTRANDGALPPRRATNEGRGRLLLVCMCISIGGEGGRAPRCIHR